ncbi:hypothetical protein KIPB_016736, partial [Kipferlia bialata]|eukprot:g16736.t1
MVSIRVMSSDVLYGVLDRTAI